MLFRSPQRVYAVFQLGLLAVLAALASPAAAQDNRNAEPTKSSADLRVRTEQPIARESRQTVKDVLGRDIFMPGEYEWAGPLPVHFLYNDRNIATRSAFEQGRRSAFLADRVAEFDAYRDETPLEAEETEDERDLRLGAMASAIQGYRDPGPALAFASVEQIANLQDTDLEKYFIYGSAQAYVWIDANNDRSLGDEKLVWANCGGHTELRDELTQVTKNVVAEEAWLQNAVLIAYQNPRSHAYDRMSSLMSTARLPASDRPTLNLDLIRSHSDDWSSVVDAFNELVLLDGSNRKSHLPQIVSTADGILDRAFVNQTISDRRDERLEDPVQVEIDRLLSEIVYRKGRALGYMELPSVVRKHPIADPKKHSQQFERNYKLLLQLNQYDRNGASRSNEYGLLSIRYHRRRGEYGAALNVLNAMSEQVPPQSGENFWHTKKRRDLYRDLGWTAWADYENRWMLRKYPLWSALLINQSTPRGK